MCNGDLMPGVFVEEFDFPCVDLNVATNQGWLECDSSNMEMARFYCCESYFFPMIVQECNRGFPVKKEKYK